ncbi:MAG TPA: hypothetical protein VKW08_26895 [Xanthobacteraceae bacterium]|nr:hypothetical protein [Xanthobacteraceae bacterium]
MYEIFDPFIQRETWFTGHANEELVFYTALSKVAWSPEFDPDRMADYFRSKLNISRDDGEFGLADAVDLWCDRAHAVKAFLKYNRISPPGAQSTA